MKSSHENWNEASNSFEALPSPPHTHTLYIWHFPTLKIHHFAPNLYSAMKFIVPLKVRGHGQFYPQDDPCD